MLDRIPKPVVFGAVAVILVLAFVAVFKSIKSAGGSGDYNAAEIRKFSEAHNQKPGSGYAPSTSGSSASSSGGRSSAH